MVERKSSARPEDGTIGDIPSGPPGEAAGQHSWQLQMLTQMTADIGKLTAKVDRLISDVEGHGNRIDKLRHQVTFVQGALWVIGFVILALTGVITWYFTGKLGITINPTK